MQPGEMVKETGYIKPGDDVPDIVSNQQFEQAIAALNNPMTSESEQVLKVVSRFRCLSIKKNRASRVRRGQDKS